MAKKKKNKNQKMRSNGHSDVCICLDCKELYGDKEPMVYGQWKTFRDFVDAMSDTRDLETVYIYPKFAVLDFRWTADAKKMVNYLEDRSADRYTGIHFDQNSYNVVLIDVANKEKADGNKSV
jgi:ribosomal protein S26